MGLTNIAVVYAGGHIVGQLANLVGEDIGTALFTLADVAPLLQCG